MSITRLRPACRQALLTLACLAAALFAQAAAAQAALQDIEFTALPDARFEIALEFSATPPSPEVFVIEQPARLTMDFANVTSQLPERRFPLAFAGADSVMILEAQGRTRMVVNLTGVPDYTTRVQGNSLIVSIAVPTAAAQAVTATPQPDAAQPQPQQQQQTAPQQAAQQAAAPPVVLAAPGGNDVAAIDFRGGAGSAGEIVITLGRAGLEPNLSRNGDRLDIEFENASIDDTAQTRLDVRDFATPVEYVSLFNSNDDVVVQAQLDGEIDFVASQIGNQFIVTVSPEPVAAAPRNGASEFTGDPISLVFQDVEVRSVLQILAEFNDFSLVVPDSVTGNITLQLEEVPWDQALDIVLRSRNLDKRLVGTVLYVAPASEIATAELAALESSQQADTLAPLVTEYIEINYAVAGTLLNLLQGTTGGGGAAAGAAAGGAVAAPAPAVATGGNGGVLSPRGRASVDARTNTIIIQDTQEVIDNVRNLIARLDVPVRQVLIEARIVNASTSFSEALGIRWGGAQTFPGAGDQFVLGGSLDAAEELTNNLIDFNNRAAEAVFSGTSLDEFLATNSIEAPGAPESLVVDLGVPSAAASTIALGFAGNNGLLQLELSALEASGNGEVIAQPKVTTQDKQTARIESGLQIPYQAQAGGTAGGSTTEFVTAALSLEVTPQITPDGRIIMLLDIHQDSVVPGSGAVPAIATNSVNTRVLVNNGDTVVLGGVFREETTTTVTKTPLLGDLPYVGNIFKRTEETESKTELLIFITPSIINEIL
ncbi:MAG: type IV pilus secretin PilQ [Gammaproteobacteria bacterium]